MVQKENPKIQTFTEEELVDLLMTAPSKKEIVLRSAMMYMRWGDTVKSPYSKDSRVYQRHCRPLEYRCSKTGNNFTATTHTVFEYSKLTYQKMFRALREYYNDEEITSTKMASALKVTKSQDGAFCIECVTFLNSWGYMLQTGVLRSLRQCFYPLILVMT